jgi:pimeloyl-ACP methyl ester carboxylesterase
MPLFAVNGTELYYESHGAGPPLVFVHGAGGNHASWWQQVPAFASDHRVIVYDQRGFGNSPDPDGRGRAAFADDLAGLLDALAIERAIVVAQSLGGGAALGLVQRRPERLRGLVLADTLLGFAEPDELAARLAETRRQTKDLPQARRVLGHTTLARNPALAMLYAQISSFNRYAVGTVPGTWPSLIAPEALAASGVPMLFIAGAEDVLFPPDCIALMQKRVAGSKLAVIAEVGHSAYFENAAAFNAELRGFLGGLPRA